MMSDRPVDGFEKASFGNSPAAPCGHNDVEHGLTKRELFAAMILQGLAACPNCDASKEALASGAVTLADALIAELCK